MNYSKLIKVRCPKCDGNECGHDAYSHFDPVLQEWVLGGTYDNCWCNECGDVEYEEYHPEGEELADLIAEIEESQRAARIAERAPVLLREIADAWPVEGDQEVNGGDIVEWLGNIVLRIRELFGLPRTPRSPNQEQTGSRP